MKALGAGMIVAGKYRLDRPLAQGGMGSVWVAFDTTLEVPVAVKLMAPALAASPELVARFEREAKAAAQLRGPNVVQVFEHGVHDGTPFMAMELLDGEDLGARLKARGRLSLWEAAIVLEQVSKALRKAHEAGIVHRDLKPANVFIARHDEDEVVKVLDFGIAKSARPTQGDGTRTGVVMGSPAYMSPEQVRSTRDVDHRSDLWSLGLVMFRVVTGKLAFAGANDNDTMIRLCTDPIPVPSSIVPDLPPQVDAFFARALERDPDRRYQSVREMAAAFCGIVGRAPSIGEVAVVEAIAPPPGIPQVPRAAVDTTKTLELAPAAAPEKTQVLAGEAIPVPSPGATLTRPGGVTSPVVSAPRGWMTWAIASCLAMGAILGVTAMMIRSARPTMERGARPSAPSSGAKGDDAPVAASLPEPTAEATSEPTAATATTRSSDHTRAPVPPPGAARRDKPKKPATDSKTPGTGNILDEIGQKPPIQ